MSEQDAMTRVVEVIFEMSEAGSVRMQELVSELFTDEDVVNRMSWITAT